MSSLFRNEIARFVVDSRQSSQSGHWSRFAYVFFRNVPQVSRNDRPVEVIQTGFLQVDRAKGCRYLPEMSTAELVAEKVKSLPEFQAQAVLTFIEELSLRAR